MNLSSRLSAAMAAIVLVTAGFVGLVSYTYLHSFVVPRELYAMELHLRLVARPIEEAVEKARDAVTLAAASSSVAEIVRVQEAGGIDPQDGLPGALWRDRLAASFVARLELDPHFLQLRLIGVDGKEMVRADRSGNGGAVRVVPEAELQMKGEQPYFEAAIGTPDVPFYVSPIELNREHDALEIPHVPVVRVARLIRTPTGALFGILIANVEMAVVFSEIRAQIETNRQVFVLNADGEYLMAPERQKEFAFETGGSARLQDDFPAISRKIVSRQSTLEVVRDRASSRYGLAILPLSLAGQRPIFVAEAVPYGELMAVANEAENAIVIGAALAGACAIALAFWVARTLIRPLAQLTAAAKAIALGQKPSVPIKAAGEIGLLARAFHAMADQIAEKEESLTRALAVQQETNIRLKEQGERERLLSAAVEASEDAIVIHDLDGRILSWNAGAEELYGYSAAEAVGRKTRLIVPADRHGEFEDLLGRVRRGERVQHFETVRHDRHGRQINVSLSVSPVRDGDGVLIGASKIAHDISARKLAEIVLANHNEDLKRSNAELEQFAYIAAHDLQEPLRMVASYTELLSERYKGQLDARADKYIGYAVDGAKRMKQLINDLLSFSRIGTQGKEFERVELQDVMDQVGERLAPSIAETGATLTVRSMPTVLGDEVQLSQLLQNLIGNALKFHGEDPTEITVAARAEGNYWVISVRDTGIGIETQYLDQIFQMFQRLHERGRYDGSGIGLAISKKIVERHRGRIWVDSKPGIGSTFYFTLPAWSGGA